MKKVMLIFVAVIFYSFMVDAQISGKQLLDSYKGGHSVENTDKNYYVTWNFNLNSRNLVLVFNYMHYKIGRETFFLVVLQKKL